MRALRITRASRFIRWSFIAQFAKRQVVDVWTFHARGDTIRDSIIFFGLAVDDPGLIKPYTKDLQSEA